MKSNTSVILVAVGALLVGGVATAAFMNNHEKTPDFVSPVTGQVVPGTAAPETAMAPAGLQYADIVKVDPVTKKEQLYASVIGTDPVRETTTTSQPHQVCRDVVVQERLPERDGNVGGTVAGAVIGGLLGNQVGGGRGRDAATLAGAVGGGFVGNRVDRNHVGGRVVNRTEQQCHTETASAESSRVTGYNVTYRNPDGSTGTMRMDKKPGTRIPMGTGSQNIGYDVTYRYDGVEKQVRLDDMPAGNRLPVIDGQIVTATTAANGAVRQ